jgi:hypothetical protein
MGKIFMNLLEPGERDISGYLRLFQKSFLEKVKKEPDEDL